MPKFIPYDHNQNTMVVINFQDQLQPGTFEQAVHYLVQHKWDLSVFNPAYKNEQQGRRSLRHEGEIYPPILRHADPR